MDRFFSFNIVVIVMTFWYVIGTDLTFLNFQKTLFSLGIDHDPHVYSMFSCL